MPYFQAASGVIGILLADNPDRHVVWQNVFQQIPRNTLSKT